ncbi:amino acid adenylation domain-containing protein [Corallococcus macrosporus]|uniref:Amino acid adenylation domain-containing protein n=1 Tax=Corallococcus macrosporus TaxID=35 RepID=A0ABS3DJ07_9BACT|nr:non-ribosomal peptide synthetase [Corallococcus macrosporus]MBN8231298.1 amino acid adenylation domain-containing protein [Corallococcus macrosporus]
MTTEHPGSPSASAPKSRRRAPPVVPVSRDALLPLSFGQQRMWFIEQLTPGGISYNVPYFARLTGALDVPALERALAVLVERHEALRTTFAVVDGQPVQRIAPSLSLPLRVESLEALPASEREQALRRTAEAEARTPFDLGAGPLVRVRLLRLGETEHVLLLMLHHICCDGWSLTVMERELQALYAAFRTGTTPALPALPVQYADHAVWQRQWLQGEHLTQQLEWWRGELSGAPPALELPTDRPRPSAQSTRGAVHRHALPPELGKALEVLCRRQGVTLFMALLGGMHLLLSRLSGQDDVVIGSPISGRTRQEVEPLIGFFINTLPLRVQGEGSLGFGELLRRVRKTCLDAYAHQEVPFEQLVDALQPERDLSRPPLFQVLFTLQHSAVPALELEGLKTSELDFEPGVSRMDLTVFLRETPEGLVSLWEYSTDLFDAATVARFAEHYTRLLEAAVAEPERPVATLPMLSEAERQRLLELGTGAAVPYPREASLPALFAEQAARTPDAVALEAGSQKLTYAEQAARIPDAIAPEARGQRLTYAEQAARTPDAVALEAGGQRLTYAELEARANQLAHHLRGQGVSLGTPVGLCASRSLEMVVATLAILKAGGAYVPLDPSYPSERLEFMARDARISVLLVEPGRESALKGLASRVVVLDPSWRTFAGHPESAPDVHIPADALAYVMYTSGSTGRPKGVGVPHRAVTRLVKGVSYVRFDAQDVVLQLATTSFDAATLELWGALLNGAKLFLYPPVTPSLEELEATLEREHISVLFLTTAFFEQMALNRPASLARVKQVITGGDVLSPLAARKLLDAGRAVVNGYGPTENTTFSATYQVKRDLDARMPVPIGRPLENSQALVLDARLEPVPPGVVGDLYVGGDGLAWGYLDRPELTADRFVPHPFSETPGARLYRTGDRARWLPSGELAFMGRADSQVKLRGFRIELGEIETALRHLPGVEDAVAEVREYAPGDKRLVAWVAGTTVDMSALRPSLAARLPAPLVPSAFVKLDRLPLTPVGKVDRKALATPMGDAPTGESSVAPVTPTETAVAEVWAALLGRTRVGAQDSFFELGGHSLLATQVVSRLRETFAVDLSVRMLFEAPTVSGLGARIDALRGEGPWTKGLPLVPGPREGWQPQSFAQQRLWIISQLDPLGASYNVPLVTRLRGPLDARALEASLVSVIERHAVLRTTFGTVDGQSMQRIGPAGDFTLQREDVDAGAVQARVEAEALQPFDLRQGPVVRARLLRVADDDHVLVLVIHHIVFDGWSIDVLQRELDALYPANGQSTLPALPIQYVDFARWQREVFQGEELEAHLTWWRDQLDGVPHVLELPADKARPAVQTFAGSSLQVPLSPELSRALTTLGQREGATLFMTLLAGFQALLSRYSGQPDFLVGSPISGRNRREVEGLLGFFVNTLALRADLSGAPSFQQLLGRVREACLGAFAHEDLPFEQLVDALKPPRDPARSPLVQILFVLQRAAAPLALPGLQAEDVPFRSGTSRGDLMLFVRQTAHGLVAYWEYSTALFEEATVLRMAAHYVRLLEGAVARPDLPVASLPLMSAEERQQVLVTWNARGVRIPATSRLPLPKDVEGPPAWTTREALSWRKEAGGAPASPPFSVYVLDPLREPCPIGVPGELYVSGEGFATEDAGRPDLAAERFVPSHLGTVPGARLYRTGERARWLADGQLERLPPLPRAAPPRAFRAELGRVETALRVLNAVRDVAVVLREDTPGLRRLVAYVVHPESTFDPDLLRQTLSLKLPEHLVPSIFVRLDALPLSPGGKVHRARLPAPPAAQEGYVPPLTEVERKVAALWASLLVRPRVGLRDHFFELGGHSLLATRVISRLREDFGVDLPMSALFEAPTVAGLAARVEALLHAAPRGLAPPLVPGSREGIIPQSHAQQRLWFISKLDPSAHAYNVPLVTRLHGPLDAPALEASLVAVIRRHEVLRTTFDEVDGQPAQRIHPAWDFKLARVDLPPSEQDASSLRHRVEAEAHVPFDLRQGPLIRATLFRLSDDDHVLVLVFHHTVFDGWSIAVLQRELDALYAARVKGMEASLPALPIQYADFARWQRDWLRGDVLEEQVAWWRRQLAGVPPVLDLPTDKPRPPVQSFNGHSLQVPLSPELSRALTTLGQREGATLFMTLLAGFQALLSRYSGQPDFLVGSPISGRNRREVEGLLGFFVNTLALRADLSGAPSFQQLLGRVREACLGAFAHEDLPFEQLVDALKPPRDPARSPLVQHLFVLQRAAVPLTLPGLQAEDVPFQTGVARFDLMLFVRESDQGLTAFWEYDTALFEEATVQRMAAHYIRLLEGAVAQPDRPVAALSLLSEEERRQVVVTWNAEKDTSFAPGLMHRWVEAQVARTPDAIAVTDGESSLTYARLEVRANQLAHHLIALGVTPGSVVGLCLERSSLDMPVAVLATLKAGAAYVPLDPDYPRERLAMMLEDTRPPVVLAHASFVGSLPPARIVTLEEQTAALATRPESPPPVEVSPESGCYVIFTSGSTGRPKGIAMSHRAVGNMVGWLIQRAVRAQATTLQFASLNFDVSFQEFFGTWCLGGRLLLCSSEIRRDPSALLRHLTHHRVERLFLPFVALQMLSEAARNAPELPPLNEVITAGEQLQVTPALVALFERLPGCVLENEYGPSETHVVTAWRASGPPATWPALPPIGAPLPNTQTYVLDTRGAPCPIGIPGELFLGGAGLASGYHRRPDLTAERFLPDPFSDAPGARMYRTGDVVRWLPDGTLEFRGRADSQVKVRGFRVELGEVEAALLALPSVKEAAVTVREEPPGPKRLVGYVVPREGTPLTVDTLRAELRRSLAEHAVPSTFVLLERLPLTPSGKVDRRALPAPEALRPELSEDYRAPEAGLEQALSAIWSQVLHVDRVGAGDNFFDLGGNSLLLQSVHAKLETLVGRKVSLVTLFQYPTVRALAAHLAPAPETPSQAPVPTTPPPEAGAQRRDNLRRMAQRRGRPPGSG